MSSSKKISIFLVDDDALYLTLLHADFATNPEYVITNFVNGESCLECLSEKPDIIVLDYYLDGINKTALNGLETLAKIRETNPEIPVIMLSSQDKIEVAVNCMKLQAFDYIVKSETAFSRLHNAISTALKVKKMEKVLSWYRDKL